MPLTIVRANPLRFESELKNLMTAHEYPEFPDFFDRGYPAAEQEGGECWVAFDEKGTAQMNVTAFVHAFRLGRRTVLAGMLGNMMVATPYRTFFPALTLLRRLVADLRHSGRIDFIYGDPAPGGAQSVFRAAMMSHVGDLERLVIPVGDSSWSRSFTAHVYVSAIRARTRLKAGIPRRTLLSAAECEEGPALPLRETDGAMRPLHSAALYRRRLPGFPCPDDRWCELRGESASAAPDAAILLRGPRSSGVLEVLALRRTPTLSVHQCVAALAECAGELGATRLQIETLRDSAFGRELVSAGFRPRGDLVPIFGHAFTPSGEEALKQADGWELTALDMER